MVVMWTCMYGALFDLRAALVYNQLAWGPHLADLWVAANKRPMDYYAGTKGRKYNTRSEKYGCRPPNQYIESV